jgi:lipoate-protein ligase A
VRTWRLLVDGSASGPFNMGVDEALLDTALRDGQPTLRFYLWRGPWLSLGYGQLEDSEGAEARKVAGLGVVRRSTGGRAVLHGCDLTYALVAPANLLPDGLQATYALIASCISSALRELHVAVERVDDPVASERDSEFDCFAAPVTDELCVGGLKLVGSAQRRVGGGVLQHGSIRMTPDPALARDAAGLRDGVATSLEELHCKATCEELRQALIRSFAEALEARFEPLGLLDRELGAARARGVDPPPRRGPPKTG